jgi:Asp-tRNA(Asn)/Glu-tRNA(Gln) amidotransferase A subunit family amidase
MTRPNELSALEAARAIEEGSLTSEALVRACLERIEERNAEVRAFVALDPPRAIAAARAADQARAGVLRGLPFAVKDVFDTADYPTAYGSPIHAGHRPPIDAGCVAMAREHGAVVLGKVATSEFATQTPSDTRNPHNPRHTPGGSSSGSAAAVADRMVPLAFGTQTTASIIRPASFCGVVGYKPTWGFIGSAGLKHLSPSQDTVGVLARTVADAAFFAFGVHGARATLQPDLRPRLAVCHSSQWDAVRPEMAEAIERTAAAAERAGAKVTRVTLPADLETLIPLQLRLFAFEARQSLAVERLHHHARLSPRLQQRLKVGEDITPAEYLAMRRQAAAGRQTLRALFENVDALLYPPATGEAPEGLLDSGSAQFGALWSLMGVPCVAVPVATGPAGLPMGTQVIGGYGEDERTLAVAEVVSRVAVRVT